MNPPPLSPDTTPDAARFQFTVLRRLRPGERAAMAMELSDAVRSTLEEGIRKRHPDYTERMVRLAAVRLSVGEEIFRRLCPRIEIKG